MMDDGLGVMNDTRWMMYVVWWVVNGIWLMCSLLSAVLFSLLSVMSVVSALACVPPRLNPSCQPPINLPVSVAMLSLLFFVTCMCLDLFDLSDLFCVI